MPFEHVVIFYAGILAIRDSLIRYLIPNVIRQLRGMLVKGEILIIYTI